MKIPTKTWRIAKRKDKKSLKSDNTEVSLFFSESYIVILQNWRLLKSMSQVFGKKSFIYTNSYPVHNIANYVYQSKVPGTTSELGFLCRFDFYHHGSICNIQSMNQVKISQYATEILGKTTQLMEQKTSRR